jgi:hypothetical protein
MKELIGKTIASMHVSEGEGFLVFKHPDGTETVYYAEGDCCSQSWFADIVGVTSLIGATVRTAQGVPMPEEITDGRGRQEYDTAYGTKLTTDKGYADIVFRNSSNGYYGGWLQYVEPGKWGRETLREIDPTQDDWRA